MSPLKYSIRAPSNQPTLIINGLGMWPCESGKCVYLMMGKYINEEGGLLREADIFIQFLGFFLSWFPSGGLKIEPAANVHNEWTKRIQIHLNCLLCGIVKTFLIYLMHS